MAALSLPSIPGCSILTFLSQANEKDYSHEGFGFSFKKTQADVVMKLMSQKEVNYFKAEETATKVRSDRNQYCALTGVIGGYRSEGASGWQACGHLSLPAGVKGAWRG